MEARAHEALVSIQRERDKLPARIAAETDHIRQVVAAETETAVQKLKKESEKSTFARIAAIRQKNNEQLTAFELDFAKNRQKLRAELFKRLTKWTTTP